MRDSGSSLDPRSSMMMIRGREKCREAAEGLLLK